MSANLQSPSRPQLLRTFAKSIFFDSFLAESQVLLRKNTEYYCFANVCKDVRIPKDQPYSWSISVREFKHWPLCVSEGRLDTINRAI